MAKKTFEHLADLAAFVGQELKGEEWLTITQAKIDMFARATGDYQWIHIDPAQAAKGPFKTTIAHGFLTLSLLPQFFEASFDITHSSMGVNYGLNKVRFTAPVPVGSKLRAKMRLMALDDIDNNGIQMTWLVTVERQGDQKPVCIAESLVRRYP